MTTNTNKKLGGHPKGLYLLFTVEMWERMSYYGMRALLTLYMTAKTTEVNPGFGMNSTEALKIYAWYTGLVYATPLLGGYLADRYLGQRRSIYIGGILMMIGHFLMAVPGLYAFYAALIFLIIGNGFFKPNISTMVGGLYEEDDPRRDSAFTIFYMGINLGAVLAGLVCGSLGEKIGFHWGFGAAGVGMALGLIIFWMLEDRLLPKNLGILDRTLGKADAAQDRESTKLTAEEVDRISVILILSIFVMFFWAAFEQAGGLMNIYTKEKVDRVIWGFEVPASWFQSLNPAIIFIFAPFFSKLWAKLGERNIDPPTPVKMAVGLLLLSFGFVFMLHGVNQADSGNSGLAAIFWLSGAYFWHTMGELCLSPIGLSMVTKLAPAHLTALMMGVWFGSNFVANLAAGYIGGYSERLGEFELFSYIVFGTAGAGVLLFLLARPIVAKMHLSSEENDAYSFRGLAIVAVLMAGLFYLYPQQLQAEREDPSFACAQSQREAKANFYRIIAKQKAHLSAASESKDATFSSDFNEIKVSIQPEEVDYTQRLAINHLSHLFNLERAYKSDPAHEGFATSWDDLGTPEDLSLVKGVHAGYVFTLKATGEGEQQKFSVEATRQDGLASEDGRELNGDRWSINEEGTLTAHTQLHYTYKITRADKEGFEAKAVSVVGKADEWTLSYKKGQLRGEMSNPVNRCQAQ
jgi:POT family proton-dependent oligopeptide transporter